MKNVVIKKLSKEEIEALEAEALQGLKITAQKISKKLEDTDHRDSHRPKLPGKGFHGGEQTETLPGGGFHGGEQTETLPGGGFHGGEQTETLPGGGFHIMSIKMMNTRVYTCSKCNKTISHTTSNGESNNNKFFHDEWSSKCPKGGQHNWQIPHVMY